MPRILEHRETGKLAVQVDVAVKNIGEGLPQETIKAIWEKANAISGVPGGNPKDRYVFSRSDGQPHFVEGKSSGIYKCDERCMHFSLSRFALKLLLWPTSSVICLHMLRM